MLQSCFFFYLKDATSYPNAYFGESSGPYHLESVRCNGHEATLLDCRRQYTTGGINNQGIGVHNCAPGNEAGVKCDGMCSQIWIRFVAFTYIMQEFCGTSTLLCQLGCLHFVPCSNTMQPR